MYFTKNFSRIARNPHDNQFVPYLVYAIGRGHSILGVIVIAITEEFRKNALIRV